MFFNVVSMLKLTLGAPTPRSVSVMRLFTRPSSRSFQGFDGGAFVATVAAAGVVPLAVVVPPAFMKERNVCPIVIVIPVSVAASISWRWSRPAGVNSIWSESTVANCASGANVGASAKIPKLNGVLLFERRSGFTDLKIVRLKSEFQRAFRNSFTEALDEKFAVLDQQFADAKIWEIGESSFGAALAGPGAETPRAFKAVGVS